MIDNTIIKKATKSDLDSILEIIYKRCVWLNDKNIDQWNLERYPIKYDKDYFEKSMKEHFLFVAKDCDKIVGLVLLKQIDTDYWPNNDGKALYIHHLATLEEYKGLGKKILDYCIEHALNNNKQYLRLDCKSTNDRLNKYYEILGFELKGSGQRNDYKYNLRELDLLLDFYKQTSTYTYLGPYNNFAKELTNDIKEICQLQRKQIIHPVAFNYTNIRTLKNTFWGDMTEVSITRLRYEDDLYPTAASMITELLRRNANYTTTRDAKDKIHTTCRSQAILLAAILKAKGLPARVRSGYAPYIKSNGVSFDHWITEYYNNKDKKWILVDADMCCDVINFNIYDMPRDSFIFGAEAYLGYRQGKIENNDLYYAGYSYEKRAEHIKEAVLRGLFYDFHCLMNNEIIFLHLPKYIYKNDFNLSESELQELDKLAKLMLEPNENFNELVNIWNSEDKYRIMSGALN